MNMEKLSEKLIELKKVCVPHNGDTEYIKVQFDVCIDQAKRLELRYDDMITIIYGRNPHPETLTPDHA